MSFGVVFFMEKENFMASDGDMFVQRKAWGYARGVKSSSFTPNHFAASVLSHFEEQAATLGKALSKEDPWKELATDFPELYEIEHALNHDGRQEQSVRKDVIKLFRKQVLEWRSF
ncbi:MAG: hypothetical protein JWR26_1031 [Pedosphaera sp.]|nr:hypothetical protein [Pedosphaera sp.]